MAADARTRRIVDDAYISALGANAGFSGDTTPINKLARSLGLEAAAGRSAVSRELGDLLRAARKAKGLKVMPGKGGDGKIKKRPVGAPPGRSRRKMPDGH